uniref:Uncharacterized protein n=1 Tax=Oryza punctata TaxID=4537 RepID=A0A0E0JIB7_ORYPU
MPPKKLVRERVVTTRRKVKEKPRWRENPKSLQEANWDGTIKSRRRSLCVRSGRSGTPSRSYNNSSSSFDRCHDRCGCGRRFIVEQRAEMEAMR